MRIGFGLWINELFSRQNSFIPFLSYECCLEEGVNKKAKEIVIKDQTMIIILCA